MATLKFVPSVAFHPGETLSEKLKEMGMSVKEFAVKTSIPEKTILAIINGSSSITSDMAIAFEIVTRIPAHFWLNKQRSYDGYVARTRREANIAFKHMRDASNSIQSLSLDEINAEINEVRANIPRNR
jgi:addiction module HigA family antidote